jgi:hypothetical protein
MARFNFKVIVVVEADDLHGAYKQLSDSMVPRGKADWETEMVFDEYDELIPDALLEEAIEAWYRSIKD